MYQDTCRWKTYLLTISIDKGVLNLGDQRAECPPVSFTVLHTLSSSLPSHSWLLGDPGSPMISSNIIMHLTSCFLPGWAHHSWVRPSLENFWKGNMIERGNRNLRLQSCCLPVSELWETLKAQKYHWPLMKKCYFFVSDSRLGST